MACIQDEAMSNARSVNPKPFRGLAAHIRGLKINEEIDDLGIDTQTERWEYGRMTETKTTEKPGATAEKIAQALRVLGPFKSNSGYYARVVWQDHSRKIESRSFKTVDRWASRIQRRIAERK